MRQIQQQIFGSFACSTFLCLGMAAGPAFAHDRTDILEAKTVHEGSWGSWSEWAFCPGPSNNAVGIDVKKEGGDGPFSDDVGVTSIKLYCSGGQEVTPAEASGGSWGGNSSLKCKPFLRNIGLNYLKNQGGGATEDDVAVYSVNSVCEWAAGVRPGEVGLGGYSYETELNENYKGNSKTYAALPPPTDRNVCGIRVKIEGNQGSGDDTALNGLGIAWCSGPHANLDPNDELYAAQWNGHNGHGGDVMATIPPASTFAFVDGQLANDIGVGADGSAWIISKTNWGHGGNNYTIHNWTGTAWSGAMPGAAVRIAVGPQGRPWVANEAGNSYEWNGSAWEERSGQLANDIGVGADGSVWIISKTNWGHGGNNYTIHNWTGTAWSGAMPGAAVRIAVGPQGRPWVANEAGNIYEWNGSAWEERPGQLANDIGVGADGTVWIISKTNRGGNGFTIHYWTGTAWSTGVRGAAVQIAVDPQGNPWVANGAGGVYHWVP